MFIRKRRQYPNGYVENKYKKINSKSFCYIAMLSGLVFIILFVFLMYKNYCQQKFKGEYSSFTISFLVAIVCFIILSFLTLIYKRSLLKKLPMDYFTKTLKKQNEKKANEKVREKIHLLSARKKNKLFFLVNGLTVSMILFIIFFIIYILRGRNFSYVEIGVGILLSLLLGAIVFFVLYVKNNADLENLQWKVSINKIEEATNNFKQQTLEMPNKKSKNKDTIIHKQNEDPLDSLFKTNHRYFIAYNELTKKQADKSFWLAVFSSVIGFLLIAVGIILLLANQTNPTYVTTVCGVLIEIISTVFLYFHTNTIKNMSKYHNKLLLSQNISIALKITDMLPSNIQNSTRVKLAEQIVSNINKYISFED